MRFIPEPEAPCFPGTQPAEAYKHAFVAAQRRWAYYGAGVEGPNPYRCASRPELFTAWNDGWHVAYAELARNAMERG